MSKFYGLRQSMSYKRSPRLQKIEDALLCGLLVGMLVLAVYGIVKG